MLSVILYGRNDQHGYNYHKRFAISLNCIAEVLSSPEDEILFVDYNTPDDEPTIVESLQDTLSEKAKKHLKIFRVRPVFHQRQKLALPVCEPLARNVALRRSNPNNKWVLSTNIDMIFVPYSNASLTEIVKDLPDGFYQLPRFEIPENLWEAKFNRLSSKENILFLKENARALHLNTIVRREDFRMFDNPGDFQLMLRKDIFKIGGFDEKMVHGWHVDSNLAKRMWLLYEHKIHSLEERLAGYHCNHTRKSSLLHSKHHAENDWGEFIQKVESPFVAQQDWGLAQEQIEEIKLNDEHVKALNKISARLIEATYEMPITLASYNTASYPLGRAFAHLIDHLCHLPKQSSIAYIGNNPQWISLLEEYYSERNFEGKVLHGVPLEEIYAKVSLIIFDCGPDILRAFLKIVKFEKEHRKNVKIIGINVMHTDFRAIFHRHLTFLTNGYVPGIVYGYVGKKRKNFKISKKRLAFSLFYFLVRYSPDKLKQFVYRRPLFKKVAKL